MEGVATCETGSTKADRSALITPVSPPQMVSEKCPREEEPKQPYLQTPRTQGQCSEATRQLSTFSQIV